ncbi:hypothetical protein [Streptosporangium roseum]|uniref:hypothetical protein n=1 Tax=Streptosporangium roseum TaxID=2001 RepID=UPI0005648B3C|nr:hypothetical protein [Streptosporangium roseum]
MRWWKILGLAGVAGVAATGVVIARAERRRQAYTPDEIRERLRARLEEASESERKALGQATDRVGPVASIPATGSAGVAVGAGAPAIRRRVLNRISHMGRRLSHRARR